ncbi:MAG: hypothetical protein AAGA61_05695, partial [Pseudomonadota bacterium]
MATEHPRAPLTVMTLIWLIACLFAAGPVHARNDNVEHWVTGELADHVAQQLRVLPRFRNVTVQVVVLAGSAPATRSDALSARLRDALQREISGREGVKVAWRAELGGGIGDLPRTGADCDALNADVLLGLETESFGNGRWRVSFRALDTVERRWIPRVALEWRGTLTRHQQLAARQIVADDSFRGDRDLPFAANQSDLIATRLAQKLRCELMRQTGGEYRIAAAETDPDDPILSLVRNQIGGIGQLDLIAGPGLDNAALTAASHTVDAGLSQYWVRLTPTDPTGDLRSVSASVYIDAPLTPQSVVEVPNDPPRAEARTMTALRPRTTDILSSIALVEATRGGGCGYASDSRYGRNSGQVICGALRLDTDVDAFVFVMNYQLQRGLVRVGPGDCNYRRAPELVRAGETTIV